MTDEVELLLRQVHPDWLHNDLIGSQAFFDAECSVARGSKVTADAAWRSHTSRGLQSAGVVDVTVGQAGDLGVETWDDPARPDRGAEHAYLDMRALGTSALRATAVRLRPRPRNGGGCMDRRRASGVGAQLVLRSG